MTGETVACTLAPSRLLPRLRWPSLQCPSIMLSTEAPGSATVLAGQPLQTSHTLPGRGRLWVRPVCQHPKRSSSTTKTPPNLPPKSTPEVADSPAAPSRQSPTTKKSATKTPGRPRLATPIYSHPNSLAFCSSWSSSQRQPDLADHTPHASMQTYLPSPQQQ